MRKAFIVIVSAFIALTVATPSFAIEFDASGSLRFQGIYNDKASSADSDKADSFRDMRLRVRTELKVTDKITLVTRFDALDKVLSSNDSALVANEDDDNIDFDRAYVRIISPVGLFVVGRQEGITWGTPFADDEDDTDRIKYILPIPVGDDKFYVGIVAEKVTEADKGYTSHNKDNDKYYVSGTYVSENFKTGLLVGFYHFNSFGDPGQAKAGKEYNDALATLNAATAYAESTTYAGAYAQTYAPTYQGAMLGAFTVSDGIPANDPVAAHAFATAAAELNAPTFRDPAVDAAYADFGAATLQPMAKLGTYGTSAEGKVWLISPYFTGTFGGLGITTELDYITGEVTYKDAPTDVDDKDVEAYSFMFETSYDAGPMGFQIGFATSSGDTDYNDDKVETMGYVSPGLDWGKMFILSDDSHGMNNSLGGGLGNHVGDGFGTYSPTMLAGYQMFYMGADFDLNETMNIGTVMCISKADDAPDTFDDDQGYEVDVKFSWKIMDNLEYTGTVAYLAAGDYWKGANEALDGEDTMALFHKLELTF